MKFFALSLLALLPLSTVAATADYNVIPLPNEVHLTGAEPFTLSADVSLIADDKNENSASLFTEYVKQSTGIDINTNVTGKYIRLKSDLNDKNAEASARLFVSS